MSLHKPVYEAMSDTILPSTLPVERILYEAELPVLYITKTLQDQTALAYVADDNEEGLFTLVVLLSKKTLLGLDNGTVSARDALALAPPWLHWTNGSASASWSFDLEDLPPKHLPHSHFMINPQHEPLIRTRATGESIVLGHMPASVVAFVADATRKAVKTVLDWSFATNPDGRPTDRHRGLYDLPIQSFAFSSFELSFAPPDQGMFSGSEIRSAAEKLNAGLRWASGDDTVVLPTDVEEREVVLRAALALTPPSSGVISEIHLSGTWLPAKNVTLTRSSRGRVRSALQAVDSENLVTYSGRLEEIDIGKFTFTLRGTPEGIERKGSFAEELTEEMLALTSRSVVVAGVERRGKLEVYAVAVEGALRS